MKFMDQYFAFKTRPKAIQNLLLEGILKRLSPFNSRNRLTYKIHFSDFTFLLITKEP